MRGTAIGLVSLLLVALFAGCASKHEDAPNPDLTAASTNGGGSASGVTALAPLAVALSAPSADWVAPGTSLDVTATPPTDATGAITYTWLYGPMGGMAPITPMKTTKTDLIDPGASASITFDEAGVFYEHCHPHPWMRQNVTILDNGQPPVTVVTHFQDGATLADFKFVPATLVLPKGSTVVYQNDGSQAHQTMLLQQDAPLKQLPMKDASGKVTADGSGWMRVVVLAQDAAGRIGKAERDVYVAPLPTPLTAKYEGSYNFTAPSQVPVPPPGPLASQPDVRGFTATGAGTVWLNFTSQDGVAANAPVDPAGDQSSISVQIASKDGTTKVASTSAPADTGSITGRISATDYTVTITPVSGEAANYTATLTVIYDPVPPTPAPYSDPSTQLGAASSMGNMPGM